MSQSISSSSANEMWSIFDARRVKAPELKGLDNFVNGFIGFAMNRRPMLRKLRAQVARVNALEGEIHRLGDNHFKQEVEELRVLARTNKLVGPALDRAAAITREGCVRAIGKRPFDVQIMGAMAMVGGAIAEMATGEGKTITAALAASIWAWGGRPVHVITVNDYLVARDAEEMSPIYEMLGNKVGHVIHETTHEERVDHYRRNIVYATSKELVADFLRDQIALGTLRNSTQTNVAFMLSGQQRRSLLVPGLFRAIVDEADSVLIDEAVTPLIISNSPDDEANSRLYRAADELASHMQLDRDFTIDWAVRNVDLTPRGERKLDVLAEREEHAGFWKGRRRREELVTQSLVGRHCYIRDEQYLISEEGEIQIIDEFTGRVMADRSWRHGLHQAIEVKENVKITSDKENLARISFQRFFRQYKKMAGMTGTAWESAGEMWQIYHLPTIRIPTNRPCIRKHLSTRAYSTMDQKWNAVVKRVCELNDKGVPVLIGTRSVLASEEVSRRLTEQNRPHQVLNASHTAQEAFIVSQAGLRGQITVATNMAGRGTDIKLARGIPEMGGLYVISTEPHGSGRVDRQLFGRAARQGDPGSAQMFASVDDDLFVRHAKRTRGAWRAMGVKNLIRIAQSRADSLGRFNRKQVLKSDDWMDESLPF
jgi:preprotein translocase subunit SecA